MRPWPLAWFGVVSVSSFRGLNTSLYRIQRLRNHYNYSRSTARGFGTTSRMSNNSATNATPGPASACVPCNSLDRSHLLEKSLVETRVAESMPLWNVGEKREEGGSIVYLYRNFTAKHFQAALDAINSMGAVAEAESHHPNFHLTNYRDVMVEIWTHKLGGVTENDLILARELDARVRIEYSPKWLKAHPEASGTAQVNVSDDVMLKSTVLEPTK